MRSVPKLHSAELDGIAATLVEVEADINVGLHAFNIVGLADKAVSEAKERVNSALKNSGIKPPTRENRRITVNLAPANVKKAGSRFDLPIAIAYLLASDQLKPFDVSTSLFVGELSLDGKLRPVPGCLNAALLSRREKIRTLFVPHDNAPEAAIVSDLEVIPVASLNELIAHLEGTRAIRPAPKADFEPTRPPSSVHLADIRGLAAAKRALAIAAAGGHNILLSGPPGTGKTMLSQALSAILPPLSREEALEVTQIWSAAGLTTKQPLVSFRPFRAPHHSASSVALLGGGSVPRPGEVSLAHRGVLFLDEFPEFHRDVLEGLRQPLEDGVITIARARGALTFPARFMLVASMNPCPCGYFEDPEKECRCTAHEILRYQKRVSGPLLDRIDIQITVPRIPVEDLRTKRPNIAEDNTVHEAIIQARARQHERAKEHGHRLFSNAELSSRFIDEHLALAPEAETFLKQTLERTFISARGYYRTLRVAQTIADLEGAGAIARDHLAEAFQYRLKTGE